ncbi:MAG TPA: hypothetical protein PLT25_06230 [Acidocella sp.]|nr:hypothetical protein [Acidocella sp.]
MSGTFNVGQDIQVVVKTATGQTIDVSGVTDFTWKARYNKVGVEPLNSPPLERDLPAGHDFTLTIDRTGGANDALFSAVESGYWAGGYPNGTTGGGAIYVFLSETDGSRSRYEGTNVTLKCEDRMNASQKAAVKQTIMGFASTFSKVA